MASKNYKLLLTETLRRRKSICSQRMCDLQIISDSQYRELLIVAVLCLKDVYLAYVGKFGAEDSLLLMASANGR